MIAIIFLHSYQFPLCVIYVFTLKKVANYFTYLVFYNCFLTFSVISGTETAATPAETSAANPDTPTPADQTTEPVSTAAGDKGTDAAGAGLETTKKVATPLEPPIDPDDIVDTATDPKKGVETTTPTSGDGLSPTGYGYIVDFVFPRSDRYSKKSY